MPTLNVSLTDDLDRFVSKTIEDGRFENADQVVRAALRTLQLEEQEYETKLAALREAIQEGIDSGIAEGDVFASVRKELGIRPDQE